MLSALEKAGYALPNNCRAGACGSCPSSISGTLAGIESLRVFLELPMALIHDAGGNSAGAARFYRSASGSVDSA